MIEDLIDKLDTSERVRNAIVAALVSEVANQQALATAAGKDPSLWGLTVAIDAFDPLEWYGDTSEDLLPVVHIYQNSQSIIERQSDTVEAQAYQGIFHLDCYGYAGGSSTESADARSAAEVRRAVRLVRNIVMSAGYVTLNMPGEVCSRMVTDVTYFPTSPESAVKVSAARIALSVVFRETSPQFNGVPFENMLITAISGGEEVQVLL